MSLQIPNEIMNIILSYREKHPIRSIICCSNCGDEEYFNDYLYIYTNLLFFYNLYYLHISIG